MKINNIFDYVNNIKRVIKYSKTEYLGRKIRHKFVYSLLNSITTSFT